MGAQDGGTTARIAETAVAVPHHSAIAAPTGSAGSGPALLLIHGIGDSSTTWGPVHSELARRFTVIAPDLLGHDEYR